MELRDALEHITTIRTQLAATERLRSLRAVPVALSGAMAIVAATVQFFVLEKPTVQPYVYLALWVGTAILCGSAAAVVVARRAHLSASMHDVANLRAAAMQLLPSLVAGAVFTTWVATEAPELLWLLPGVWQLLFALGNLAAQMVLPRAAMWVGMLYLCSGAWCLWLGERALDPWAMGLPFAAGQLALASILWWHHERGEWR
ncbi:MAG: hypothetical protein NXI31_14475 [bacterium]|nr:hypothetical protein [bacterium]